MVAGSPGYTSPMTRVLLAIDESDGAHFAALTAASLFGPEATYLAVHVEPAQHGATTEWGPVYGYPYPAVPPASVRDHETLRAALDEARLIAAQQAGAIGIGATPVGEIGDPATAIERVADEYDVDVVVVGSHQRGWFQRLFEDSVVDDLLRAGGIPLLVVPEPDFTTDSP
jgi:nucleotide-binding universal stress UspA family protein